MIGFYSEDEKYELFELKLRFWGDHSLKSSEFRKQM